MDLSTLGSICALATALSWAVAVLLFKHSGEHMSPVALNLFKNVVGLLLLVLTWPFVVPLEELQLDRDTWLLLASGALGVGIADVWLFAGLNRLGPSLQAVADGVYAPIVVAWSYVLLGEVLSGWDAVGAGLILTSLLLVSLPQRGLQVPRDTFWAGIGYSTAAIALMAFSIVWVKPVLERHDVVHATTVRMLGGVVLLLGYLCFDRRERLRSWSAFRPQPMWRVAVPGAVIGTYVALMLWVAGFKYAPASVAAILNQTSVLFIVLLAAVFLGERLSPRSVFAVGLGFVGSLLVLVV